MSISDIDRFGRLLNNLYTAVFERPQQKFNQPFRNVITAHEDLTLSEEALGEPSISSAPIAIAYAALTNGGSYVPATGFITAESITYGTGIVVDETQMWLIAKINPTYAFGSCPVAKASVFEWADDATHHLSVYFDQASTSWVVERQNGGTLVSASVVGTHTANAAVYLAVQWTSSGVSIALGSGLPSWTTVAGTQIPTLAATTFRIGGGLGMGKFKMEAYGNFVALGTGNILASTDQIFWLAKYAYTDGYLTYSGSTNLAAVPTFLWGGGTWAWNSSYFGAGSVEDHEPSRVGECNAS